VSLSPRVAAAEAVPGEAVVPVAVVPAAGWDPALVQGHPAWVRFRQVKVLNHKTAKDINCRTGTESRSNRKRWIRISSEIATGIS